jgi:hypothetical protein
MDPLATLYERLRQRANVPQSASQILPGEPPPLEDWLRYWNDADTDLGNLRNFDHWLSRTRREAGGNH